MSKDGIAGPGEENRPKTRKGGERRAGGAARGGRVPTGRASIRPPQQARSRATRRRVLAAAIACFERHGYEETTTAMIAARAGVAVGSVYNYFQDKRALILELLDETRRELVDRIVAGLDPADWRGRTDPRVQVRRLIDAVFHAQSLRPGIQRILWARYFKDPDFAEPFDAIRARLQEAIVDFVAAIDEQGLCRADLDRRMAPFVILNAVQWNATQAFMNGSPRFVDRAARATAELVAGYVFAEPMPRRAARSRSKGTLAGKRRRASARRTERG
ncbi:MAG: TetR/AcrR family transcriptional regulator [Myxococcota bacterium]